MLAGHGVGKTAFLVGVALDELLRAGRVLHVCLDQPVAHVRAHYDTVFEELAASTHLENGAELHAEVDRHRSIRVYPPNTLTASKLRDAVKFEIDAGAKPSLLILEGLDCQTLPHDELAEIKALAARARRGGLDLVAGRRGARRGRARAAAQGRGPDQRGARARAGRRRRRRCARSRTTTAPTRPRCASRSIRARLLLVRS